MQLFYFLFLTRNVHRILALFTPLVTGSFLIILALQLGGVFLEGMMGLQGESLRPDYSVTILSFAVFFLIIMISNKGKGWVKNYAVLIGIISGWSIYALLGKTSASSLSTDSLIKKGRPFRAIIVKDGEIVGKGVNEILATHVQPLIRN